jgi:hypothetical protein
MATSKSKDKKVDLPPKGASNPDPITKAPGAHPIETGVGTAVGGAAAGFAAGMAAGPVGAAVGTVAGGIIGGLAGKGVGEMIDPTTEDQWVREYYDSRPDAERTSNRSVEEYRGPYHYGLSAKNQFGDRRFEDVEPNLRSDWDRNRDSQRLSWDEARPAIRHAYCRRPDSPAR